MFMITDMDIWKSVVESIDYRLFSVFNTETVTVEDQFDECIDIIMDSIKY